jgi:hypothetical protein
MRLAAWTNSSRLGGLSHMGAAGSGVLLMGSAHAQWLDFPSRRCDVAGGYAELYLAQVPVDSRSAGAFSVWVCKGRAAARQGDEDEGLYWREFFELPQLVVASPHMGASRLRRDCLRQRGMPGWVHP